MKPSVVKHLNVAWSNVVGGDLAALPGERAQDVPTCIGAGHRELVFTALVRKEGVNFCIEGMDPIEFRSHTDLYGAFDRLCKVRRIEGHEETLTLTLKIQPVCSAAEIDAACVRMGHSVM